eukprot:TRINITY_DN57604_c0_g1_i1.p1 TRINITY_DN57604_c0_g1~~TRINITY_DN57604_c0_g1_i1.p1  ORF type:complete len:160 (+),score=45.07 TRINITY_DN57604_c0_g1_i1:39-482(+)
MKASHMWSLVTLAACLSAAVAPSAAVLPAMPMPRELQKPPFPSWNHIRRTVNDPNHVARLDRLQPGQRFVQQNNAAPSMPTLQTIVQKTPGDKAAEAPELINGFPVPDHVLKARRREEKYIGISHCSIVYDIYPIGFASWLSSTPNR